MNLSTRLSDIARSPGDPKIQQTGPSSLSASDRLARGLGWFSLALGAVELMAPGYITRTLGLNGKEALVRAYGARELAAAVPTLSVDSQVGLASRIAGDVMDIATLLPALGRHNPQRGKALVALAAVGAVTALDCIAFGGVSRVHSRDRGRTADYSDRSGLPRGIVASRVLARRDRDRPESARSAA
jgi:hypothetical protein